MKTYLLILLVVVTTQRLAAQETPLEMINKVNAWVAEVESLSPFGDETGAVVQRIDSLNALTTKYMMRILSDPRAADMRLDTLLKMASVTSPDKRVQIFAFFENTGGTNQSYVNFLRHTMDPQQPNAEILYFCETEKSDMPFSGNITAIENFEESGRTVYLLLGTGLSCSTCQFDYATVIEYSETGFYSTWCMLNDHREGDGELSYDPIEQTLSYDYMVATDDPIFATDCVGGMLLEDGYCHYSGTMYFVMPGFREGDE